MSFACVCAIMLFFIWLAPLMTDNFIFSHDIRPGYAKFYTGSQITMAPLTLASAWRQAVELYSTWCGRFTGNLAVFLLFLLPHWAYALLAAALYGLYLLALLMCIFGRAWQEKISAGWIFGIAALLWASVPSYGEAFFWLSVGGQIALLGQALIFLPFRFALDRPFAARCALSGTLAATGLFAAGAAVCMLDYPTSAVLPPTAIACVIFLWRRDRAFPWILAACALGLCIGAAATLGAPGNSCRLALTNDPTVHVYLASSWIERILDWLLHLPQAIWIQFAPCLLLAFSCVQFAKIAPEPWIRHIPSPALLFFTPACLTCCAYLFTAWPPSRAFATSSAQLLVCACIMFTATGAARLSGLFRFLRALLCAYCVCSLAYEGTQFWVLHREFTEREELLAHADEEAELRPFSVKPDRHQPLGGNLGDISSDPKFWINRAVASHYGLKAVRLLMPGTDKDKFVYHGDSERQDGLEIKARNARLQLLEPQPQDVHIYYHGGPGILARLPFGLDKRIMRRLLNAKEGDWELFLVPLLMARLDLAAGKTDSGQLKLNSASKLWLVPPGQPWWSMSVIPLENAGKTDGAGKSPNGP